MSYETTNHVTNELIHVCTLDIILALEIAIDIDL